MARTIKVIEEIARGLLVLCLPVLLLTASVSLAMNCIWLYHHGFARYDVSSTTGLVDSELDRAARGLIGYFNSSEEFINLVVEKDGQPFTLFNDREIRHLKDVKDLFGLVYKLLLGTGVFSLAVTIYGFYRRKWSWLGWGLLGGGILTLGLMLVLGLTIAFGFDSFFRQFHVISFANDLWMLDPSTDYLVRLFPQGFWFDATTYIAAGTAAGALVMGGLGWWLKRRGGS